MNDGDLDWMRMSKVNQSSNESMTDAALSAVLRVSDRLPRLLGATEDSVDDSWKELAVRAEVPRRMPGARAFDTTYELGDKLGNGKFSSVFKGHRKSDKKAVAVKVRPPRPPGHITPHLVRRSGCVHAVITVCRILTPRR